MPICATRFVFVIATCELLPLPFFFFNDPATPEISPLPLHDALPISDQQAACDRLVRIVGVLGVDVYPRTGSLVVRFDPGRISGPSILAALADHGLDGGAGSLEIGRAHV